MRRALLAGVAGGLVVVASFLPLASGAAATDDDYSCPAGTVHDYKVEPLDGHTFVVPTPPAGWTVEAVILKIGGPGGGQHITFTPVTPGQVLDVSQYQNEISHAHVCKGRTTSTTTSSTSTTTSTTQAPTTTTPGTTTAAEPTTSAPTTSTDAPTSTSSSSTSSTTSTSSVAPSTSGPTTTLSAVIDPPLPPSAGETTTTTTGPPSIPVTGAGKEVLPWATLALSGGAFLVLLTRRRAATA